jgi:hypothetical protein
VTPTSGVVVAGETLAVTAEIIRGGGFAGAVAISATGAPAGVTVAAGTIDSGVVAQTVTIATTTATAPGATTLVFNAAVAGVNVAPVEFALTVTAASQAIGVLLSGPPDDPAIDWLVLEAPTPAEPEDILDGILLTRIVAFIRADATVGQVNAALDVIGGRIVSMRPGEPGIAVAVPRQVDRVALQALTDTFAALPGIRSAYPGDVGEDKEAPQPPADSETNLLHLRDTRFVAAWNARRAAQNCANDRVVVLVVDNFRQGTGTDFDFLFRDFTTQLPGLIGAPPPPTQSGGLRRHGYDVLSTMAAAWDETAPTGALPFTECLDIRPLPRDGLDEISLANAIEAALPATGNVIASHAWGYRICPGCDQSDPSSVTLDTAFKLAEVAVTYRRMLNRHAQRLLTVSAAGNERDDGFADLYPGFSDSDYDSPMNIAGRSDAQMSWITNGALWNPQCNTFDPCNVPSLAATVPDELRFRTFVLPADPAENAPAPVLIVGSVTRGNNEISEFSERGDVYAVGEAIPMLPGDTKRGTSFAAPQLSALAAYLWTLSPELRGRPVADTIAAIMANTCNTASCADVVAPLRTAPCTTINPGCADVIDAYATVLSLDSGRELSPAASRIRLALLDVNNNGTFDGTDLFAFRDAYLPGGAAVDPVTWDDSRHDLNGDGFTGGSRRAPFDLDPESSARFGRATLTEVTTEIATELVTYDETAVTDTEILCYYAYSGLYDASTLSAQQSRDTYLAGLCTPVIVTVDPSSATVIAGNSVQLTASVTGVTNMAVNWSLPEGGGTIAGDGRFTAGTVDGRYAVRATSAVDPAAFATAWVTVGFPRSWVGTFTFSGTSQLDYMTTALPHSPGSPTVYTSYEYKLAQSSAATVTVAVEIDLQGVPGTVEDFILGAATGSGSLRTAETSRAEYYEVALPGCVLLWDRGDVYTGGGGQDIEVEPISLQLGSAGNYTLFFSSAGLVLPGERHEWDITDDAPGSELDCHIPRDNRDYTESMNFWQGVGFSSSFQASGVITNGEITGSATVSGSRDDDMVVGSTGSSGNTVTWVLIPR